MILTKRKYSFNVAVYAITVLLLLTEVFAASIFAFNVLTVGQLILLENIFSSPITTQQFFSFSEFGAFPIAIFLLLLVHKQRNKPGKIVFWVMIAGSALRYVPFIFQFYNPLGISFGILSILIIIFIGFNTKNFVELMKQYRKNKEEQSQANGAA